MENICFLFLWTQRRKNCKKCPETLRLIEKIPGMKTAFFSILAPQKHLPAHRGPFNGVLRYHLGLIIPQEREQCRIIRTDLGSCGLLTVVLQLLLISDLEHGFESKLRASGSIISLGMSPFSVFPQVRDHRFEGATIPGAITLAQRPKELR